jgi:CheY-like chemotaxis protein
MEMHEGGTAAAPSVILVAEDEWLVRQALADCLRAAGHVVREVSNGREAVDVLCSHAPIDLVVTDIRMPGEPDGLGVLACARRVRPFVPVIVASGHVGRELALAGGAVASVGKPYELEALVALVRDCLAARARPARGA